MKVFSDNPERPNNKKEMIKIKVITINVSDDILKILDFLIDIDKAPSRSELIRRIINEHIIKMTEITMILKHFTNLGKQTRLKIFYKLGIMKEKISNSNEITIDGIKHVIKQQER